MLKSCVPVVISFSFFVISYRCCNRQEVYIPILLERLIYTPRNSLRFPLCMKEKLNVEAHNLARYALALGQGCHLWLLESYDPVMIPTILAFD
jgi:hypothetical protein